GRQRKQREKPAVDLDATVIDLLVFGSAADTFIAAETSHLAAGYSLLTGRRLRPFARRRFRTRRPVFVLIRTKKPCVPAPRRGCSAEKYAFPSSHPFATETNRQC